MLLTLCGMGCSRKAGAPAPPPPSVTVSQPAQREVIDWDAYTGFLASPQSVDVRARVGGQVVAVQFNEGTVVQQGQVLVKIDPRPYQADLAAKLAAVQQANAQVALTTVELGRNQQAVSANAVSQQELDTARANDLQAHAQLASANAAVDASRLNVEWSTVVAPITGRISYKYVTEGNLIGGGTDTGTLLTTIQSIDPMYCYVDVDEGSVLKYKRLSAEQKRTSARDVHIHCFMQLANENTFPHSGVIDFVDNKVNQQSGTLRVRGVFPNADGFLEPGLFARMRIPGSERYNAILIPDAAIGTQQNLKYVYLMGADNKAVFRTVTLGTAFGSLRSIVEGIRPDDRVIVNGLLSVHDGSPVTPQEQPISMAGFEQTAAGSPTTQAMPTTQRAPVARSQEGAPQAPGSSGQPGGPANARPAAPEAGHSGYTVAGQDPANPSRDQKGKTTGGTSSSGSGGGAFSPGGMQNTPGSSGGGSGGSQP